MEFFIKVLESNWGYIMCDMVRFCVEDLSIYRMSLWRRNLRCYGHFKILEMLEVWIVCVLYNRKNEWCVVIKEIGIFICDFLILLIKEFRNWFKRKFNENFIGVWIR